MTQTPRRITPFPLMVLLLWFAALSSLSGCNKQNIDLDDPEHVAKIWGELICDRRGDLMNIQVKHLEKRLDNANVHGRITAGDAKKANPLEKVESVLQFVRSKRGTLNRCTVSIENKKPLDGGAKLGVDILVKFRQIERMADGGLRLIDHTPTFHIELTNMESKWFVTREPASQSEDKLLGLVAPEIAAAP